MSGVEIVLTSGVIAGAVSGIFSLVDKLLQRKWKKDDDRGEANREIVDSIKALDEKVTSVADALEQHRADDARRGAITCRTRILRFADELINERDRKHTKGHFEQVLADISDYDRYCAEHPEFKNSVTEQSAEIITETYSRCARERTFL